MKTSKIYTLALAAVVALAILLGNSFAASTASTAGPTRVALCDVVHVFNNYARADDLTNRLNEKRKALQLEGTSKLRAVEQMQMELEGLVEGSPQFESRLADVQKLEIERQAWGQIKEAAILREHHRLTKEMYNQILAKVAQVAKARNIDLVMYQVRGELLGANTQQLLQEIAQRRILFASEGMDLTDIVLTSLNDDYSASK